MPAYQPDDVNDILRRAAELQARTQGTPDVGGLTPDDLATLGQEIGIDPAFVAEALRQRARGEAAPAAAGGGFFGGPARVRTERTVPSPLTDDLWNEMVEEMRTVTGESGDTGGSGSSRLWSHRLAMSGVTRAILTAAPAREGTRVTVERYTAHEGASIFSISISLVLLATLLAAMAVGLPGLGVGALALVFTFVAARFAYGRRVRKVARETGQMLDRLELAALRETLPAATSARISLPTADAPDAVTDVRGGTRTSA